MWRKARAPLLVLGSCTVVAVALSGFYYPAFQKLKSTEQEKKIKEERIQRLQQENNELAEKIRDLSNPTDNPLYLERVARQKIGLVRDGEVVYNLKQAGSQ